MVLDDKLIKYDLSTLSLSLARRCCAQLSLSGRFLAVIFGLSQGKFAHSDSERMLSFSFSWKSA